MTSFIALLDFINRWLIDGREMAIQTWSGDRDVFREQMAGVSAENPELLLLV